MAKPLIELKPTDMEISRLNKLLKDFEQDIRTKNYDKIFDKSTGIYLKYNFKIAELFYSVIQEAVPDILKYMEKIPSNFYEANDAIRSIKIPFNIKRIASSAFRYCKNLTNVIIPSSVISFGALAFADIPKLRIKYEGTEEQWDNIVKDSTWKLNTGVTIHCTDGDVKE